MAEEIRNTGVVKNATAVAPPVSAPADKGADHRTRHRVSQLLLARGADPIERHAERWATPRAWAEKRGHRDVLALLPERE